MFYLRHTNARTDMLHHSPGRDGPTDEPGHQVGGGEREGVVVWMAAGSKKNNNNEKMKTKQASHTVYIQNSTVSVLLTVLVLLPKPNYDVVVMSHPQRQ